MQWNILTKKGADGMDEKVIALTMLQAAKDSAEWAYWSMIGTCFSGMATFFAVITSLYIALRDRKAFIGGKVRTAYIITEDDDRRIVGVTVVNRSMHAIRIRAILWDVGGGNELQQFFRNAESDPLPIRLENGDEANYRIMLDDDDSWFRRMAVRLKKVDSNPKKLRCIIALSTGEKLRLKVDKRIKEKILQYM